MHNFASVSEQEAAPIRRSKWQWLLLLVILITAALLVLLVLRNIKPVTLHNQPSLAAPVITLKWQLSDSENTVNSKIYRTTDKFLSEPVAANLVATVVAPTATYQDSNVTMGTTYYYSIFEIDKDGEFFDPSYFSVQPTDANPSPQPQSQPGPTSPAAVSIKDLTNFKCGDGPTIYVYYQGHKEIYTEAAVFLSWNDSWSGIVNLTVEECSKISGENLVRLPDSALLKTPNSPTVWHVEGGEIRPIASMTALLKISAQPKIVTVSDGYLKIYKQGALIK